MNSILIKLIVLFQILCIIHSEIEIINPKLLRNRFKAETKEFDIKHRWGNFGKIPYGRTLVGRIYWDKEIKDNTYCDSNNLPIFTLIKNTSEDNDPIFLVDS